MRGLLILPVLFGCAAFAQSFDVASVKPSARAVGRDYNNQVTLGAGGFTGRNTTLKRLIAEAYGLQPYQVSGGPKWLDENEYDVLAKTEKPAGAEQARAMLRALLAERFHLLAHRET